MKRKKPTVQKRNRIRRERDPLPWRYCLLTLGCGLILVGGFFFAARLHFSAIELGIDNANLRRDLERLKTENRLAILKREMAISGVNKVAQKIGFRKRTVRNIEVVRENADQEQLIAAVNDDKAVKAFTNSETLAENKQMKLADIERKMTSTVTGRQRRDNTDRQQVEKDEKSGVIRERKAAVKER